MNNNPILDEFKNQDNNTNNTSNDNNSNRDRRVNEIHKLYINKDKPKKENPTIIYVGIIIASLILVILGIFLIKGETLQCTKTVTENGMEITTDINIKFEKNIAISGTSKITAKLVDKSLEGYWDTSVSALNNKYVDLVNPRYENNSKKHIYKITSDIDIGINVLYDREKANYVAEGYNCK